MSHTPFVAIDKMEVKLTLKVTTVVKLDRLAKAMHVSRNAIIAMYLDSKLDDLGVFLTREDLARAEEIMQQNQVKRRILKARIAKKEAQNV